MFRFNICLFKVLCSRICRMNFGIICIDLYVLEKVFRSLLIFYIIGKVAKGADNFSGNSNGVRRILSNKLLHKS